LTRWEDTNSPVWQFILVGTTFGAFILSIALTVVLFVFFGGGDCQTNTFLITVNLILTVILTVSSVAPAVQEANPKSGLAQASIVSLYSTYLVASAVANHNDPGGVCNPLTNGSSGARTTTVILGAIFTFLAVAYSTTRAATQTKALGASGAGKRKGAVRLPEDDIEEDGHGLVSQQPKPRRNEMRYQAILAAVEEGALPRSALDEADEQVSDDGEGDEAVGEERDDERTQTKYSVSRPWLVGTCAPSCSQGLKSGPPSPAVHVVSRHLHHGEHVRRRPADRLVRPLLSLDVSLPVGSLNKQGLTSSLPSDPAGASFGRPTLEIPRTSTSDARKVPCGCASSARGVASPSTSGACTSPACSSLNGGDQETDSQLVLGLARFAPVLLPDRFGDI